MGLIQKKAPELDEVHFVTAIHRLAKHSVSPASKSDPQMVWLLQQLQGRLESMKARHLANTAWAFARLTFASAPLRQSISSASRRLISDFRPPELASTAWSYAAMRYKDWPLISAIASAARPLISEFDPQGLSGTAWSIAQIGYMHEPLLAAIAEASIARSAQY